MGLDRRARRGGGGIPADVADLAGAQQLLGRSVSPAARAGISQLASEERAVQRSAAGGGDRGAAGVGDGLPAAFGGADVESARGERGRGESAVRSTDFAGDDFASDGDLEGAAVPARGGGGVRL